jgi:hypothetical protein
MILYLPYRLASASLYRPEPQIYSYLEESTVAIVGSISSGFKLLMSLTFFATFDHLSYLKY